MKVSVGFVRNSDVLEFAALDPQQGVKFYVLVADKKPSLARNDGCLRCHQGEITFGIPGLMVSSVHPSSEGRSMHGSSFVTDQRTPFKERWGGWYVTGTHWLPGSPGKQHRVGGPGFILALLRLKRRKMSSAWLIDSIHPGIPLRPATL